MGTATVEQKIETLRDAVLEVAEVLHNWGFGNAPDRVPHKRMEQLRVDLGDTEFADHIDRRTVAEAKRASDDEGQRNAAIAQAQQIGELRKQLAASSEANAAVQQQFLDQANELAELKAMVAKLTTAQPKS